MPQKKHTLNDSTFIPEIATVYSRNLLHIDLNLLTQLQSLWVSTTNFRGLNMSLCLPSLKGNFTQMKIIKKSRS